MSFSMFGGIVPEMHECFSLCGKSGVESGLRKERAKGKYPSQLRLFPLPQFDCSRYPSHIQLCATRPNEQFDLVIIFQSVD